jgi:hypothetical protein
MKRHVLPESILKLENLKSDPFWSVFMPYCPACGQYLYPRWITLHLMHETEIADLLCRSCRKEIDSVMDRSPLEMIEEEG